MDKISTDLKNGVKIGNTSVAKREALQPIFFTMMMNTYNDFLSGQIKRWHQEYRDVKSICIHIGI